MCGVSVMGALQVSLLQRERVAAVALQQSLPEI